MLLVKFGENLSWCKQNFNFEYFWIVLFNMELSSVNTITTEKEQYNESIRLILLYAQDSLYPLVTIETELDYFSSHNQQGYHLSSLWGGRHPKIHIYLHLNMWMGLSQNTSNSSRTFRFHNMLLLLLRIL